MKTHVLSCVLGQTAQMQSLQIIGCDLEGERCIANWKTRDTLTKHLKFVEFHRGQLAALMPVATCVVAVVISTLTGLLN